MKNNRNRSSFIRTSVALMVASTLSTTSVYAEESEENSAENKDENKVIVTGSRIKRAQAEGAAPVIRITNEDMSERGYTTVSEALKNLTQNNGFQFEGAESTNGFTPDVQTLNLRSSGVGTTLTLINGRRIANYPAAFQASSSVVNFGAIPAAAVESIEILATGASAIYGSDAVAGVININLKEEVDDTSINLLIGGPTETKTNRNTTRLQIVSGLSNDEGNLTAAVEYQKREPILAGDYKQFDSDLDYPYGQGVLRRNNLDLDYWALNGWALDSTGEGYRDPGEGTCEAMNNGTERSFREGRGYFCGKDSNAQTNFRNESEKLSLMLSGRYDLGGMEFFGELLAYQSESRSHNDGLWISEDILDTSASRSNVFGIPWDWYLAQRRFTEEELDRSLDQTFEEDAISFSVGLRGNWGFHDWELSATRGDYSLSQDQPWWKAEEVINVFLGDYEGVGFFGDNWWAGNGSFGLQTGPNGGIFSPVDRDLVNSAIGNQHYDNETSTTSLQFVLNGDIADTDAGPISYALVAEYEKSEFKYIPDDRLRQDPVEDYLVGSGWWNLTGYNGNGDRTRSALGLETRVPISESLTLNLAARLDNYDSDSSSIGTRTTPSASIEWRPTEDLLVRAGYTESFRAPDLVMVYMQTGFFTSATDFVQCYEAYIGQGGDPATFNEATCTSSSQFVRRTPGTQLSGDEALKDETGFSRWIGFAWDVSDDLLLTVDYTKILLEDRVRTESISGLLRDEFQCLRGNITGDRCDYVNARIDRQVDPTTGVSFIDEFNASPVNRAADQSENIDVRLNYRFDTSFGKFSVNMDYTHLIAHDQKNNPGDEWQDLRDDPFLGGWDFRSIFTGTLSYSYDNFSTALTGIRRGSTTRWRPGSVGINDDMRVDKYLTYNWTARYDFNDSLSTRLRIVNVFDEGAPEDDTFLFFDTPWYNPYVYGGSNIGREAYLEVNYTF